MTKGVLFDLDETLLDRCASLRAFTDWQARRMLCLDEESVTQFVNRFIELDCNGKIWKDTVYKTLVTEFKICNWSADELLNSYILTFCTFCRARSNFVSLLEHLYQKNIPVGVVSNGKSPFQERNLASLHLGKYLKTVVVSDAVKVRKPDAEIFLLACSKLGIKPDSSVFVGDDPVSDIQGAASVGMTTIYVPTHFKAVPSTVADFTCLDTSDLKAIVDKIFQ